MRTILPILSLLLVLLGVTGPVHAQPKRVTLFNADQYYAKEDYASALTYYRMTLNDSIPLTMSVLPYEVGTTNQKLQSKDVVIDSTKLVPLEDYVNHQIGMCLHYTSDYYHAVEQFKMTSSGKSFPDDGYYHGYALMNLQRWEEAQTALEAYIELDSISPDLLDKSLKLIAGCTYALDESSVKYEVIVEMADTVVFNKGTSSFAPMYWGSPDRMLFTSAREGGVIFDEELQQSEYLCDLYWTEKDPDGNWGPARNFGRPLNSAQHDASGCFNNNNVIFYTRWSDESRKTPYIYLARMQDLKFFEAYRLDSAVNVPGYKSINPFVTEDGGTLYFSSDRPGGKGGMDIWRVAIDENGNVLGEAENLGDPVNSSLDEVTPFYHKSTLFFSSEGHGSLGGLDIYKSFYQEDIDYFTFPVNLAAPINSGKDDAYMVWDENLEYGYFSSDRDSCESGHCYDIYHVTNEPIEVWIEGLVFDAETDDVIPNASVTFIDVHGGQEPFILYTDDAGFYSTQLDMGMEYFMKAQKPKYFADAASADTRYITETTTLVQDFFLNRIPTDEIEIAGIEYDFDSDKLRSRSEAILDTLYEFLMLNNNLVVEINSHTDAQGGADYNMGLSERRAQSCVTYLISKGIPSARLIPRGYGETQPAFVLDENKDPILDSEGNKIQITEAYIAQAPTRKKRLELHQRNRRTAFKVVGEGFMLESQ